MWGKKFPHESYAEAAVVAVPRVPSGCHTMVVVEPETVFLTQVHTRFVEPVAGVVADTYHKEPGVYPS